MLILNGLDLIAVPASPAAPSASWIRSWGSFYHQLV